MGDVTNDIHSSFGLSEDDKKNYDTIAQRLEWDFIKRNIIFECAQFNQRKHEEGESVDDFVTALHCLSCNENFVPLLKPVPLD